MFVDEAAYVLLALILKIVMPIFEVGETCLAMVSTLSREENFITDLLDYAERKAANGENVINFLRQTLVCKMCMKRPDAIKIRCTHMQEMVPKWKDFGKLEFLVDLMGEQYKESLMLESFGLSGQQEHPIFPPDAVSAIVDLPPFEIVEPNYPGVAILAMDPNSAGPNDMTVCCVARLRGQTVVCVFFFSREKNSLYQ